MQEAEQPARSERAAPPVGTSPWVTRSIGVICLLMALLVWSLALLLRVPVRAALVGGFALCDGALLGICLAGITRTRRPWLIYLWLAGALLTFWPLWNDWPLWQGWPVGDPSTLYLWVGAPSLAANYYDLLHIAGFLLGLPYPFARFAQHGPD